MLIPVYLLALALEGGLLPWLVGSEAFSDAKVLHVSPVHCPNTSVLVLPALLGTSPWPQTIPFVRGCWPSPGSPGPIPAQVRVQQ